MSFWGNALTFGTKEIGVLICSLCSLAIFVLLVIGLWKIFEKCNEKPWKALIPFYNMYILFKVAYRKETFVNYLCASIVMGVLEYLVEKVLVVGTWYYYVVLVLTLVAAFYTLYLQIKLARYVAISFGKSMGFAVGLLFLDFIFYMILGFGNAKYLGNGYNLESSSAKNEKKDDTNLKAEK